jgi:hypothetical protein
MRPWVVLFAMLGLLVSMAACTGEESAGAPSTTFAPVTTTTSTILAPTTTATSTTSPDDSQESDANPFPAGEPVDLVYISDSGGAEVAEKYAALTSEALDREVRLHDLRQGGMSITSVPALVRGSTRVVADAEIIVLYAHPGGLEYDLPEPNILTCFQALDVFDDDYAGPEWTPGTKWEPTPVVPEVEDWQPYRDVLDEVYGEIWEARDGRPVVLRAHDIYNGFIAPWRELGIEPECTANWEVEMQVIREAAEANGAVFVSFFDAFNGSGHDEDPREKGWMQDDGMHANEEGGAVAAEALIGVGFELSEPPQ